MLDILNINEKTLPLIQRIIHSKSTPKLSDKRVQTEGDESEKKRLELPFVKWKVERTLG